MKKILIALMLCVSMFLSVAGCGKNKDKEFLVNVENGESLTKDTLGVKSLIEIGNGLYYDSITKNVYWWNGRTYLKNLPSEPPTAYIAPNGLAYLYDVENNMRVENNINTLLSTKDSLVSIEDNDYDWIVGLDDESLAVLVSNGDYPDEVLDQIAKNHDYTDLQDMINDLVDKGELVYIPPFTYRDKDGNKHEYTEGTYTTNRTVIYSDAVEMGVIKE